MKSILIATADNGVSVQVTDMTPLSGPPVQKVFQTFFEFVEFLDQVLEESFPDDDDGLEQMMIGFSEDRSDGPH